MSCVKLIEQIKNLAAKHVVERVEFLNQMELCPEIIYLAEVASVESLIKKYDLKNLPNDFFLADLRTLIQFEAGSSENEVICHAIVQSHVWPMSGPEVMERALRLHESFYDGEEISDARASNSNSYGGES